LKLCFSSLLNWNIRNIIICIEIFDTSFLRRGSCGHIETRKVEYAHSKLMPNQFHHVILDVCNYQLRYDRPLSDFFLVDFAAMSDGKLEKPDADFTSVCDVQLPETEILAKVISI